MCGLSLPATGGTNVPYFGISIDKNPSSWITKNYLSVGGSTNHDSIPLIPFGVAAQKGDTHAFLHQDIFAIAQFVAKLDLVACKPIVVLQFPWPILQYR